MDADSVDPAELKAILAETSVRLQSRPNGWDAQRNKGRAFCAYGIEQEA